MSKACLSYSCSHHAPVIANCFTVVMWQATKDNDIGRLENMFIVNGKIKKYNIIPFTISYKLSHQRGFVFINNKKAKLPYTTGMVSGFTIKKFKLFLLKHSSAGSRLFD